MNNDDNKSAGGISEEMEIRIMSWVLGEASPAESDELARICAERPEAAAFCDKARQAAKAASRAAAGDELPMKMSEDRRKAMLRSIGTPVSIALKNDTDMVVLREKWNRRYPWMVAVAACAMFGLFVTMYVPTFQKIRPGAEHEMEAKSKTVAPYTMLLGLKRAEAEKKEVAVVTPEPAGFEAPTLSESPSRVNPVVPRGSEDIENRDKYVADQAPVVLAPFEVSATEDKGGYRAESTLAGTRVRPNLNINLGANSAAGSQFLKDTGATSGSSVLAYTPSTEASGAEMARAAPQADSATVVTTTTTSTANLAQDEPTVLSPFVVDSSQDKGGYQTESTLAGTRVRTDLKGANSATTNVTDQFLKDTTDRMGPNHFEIAQPEQNPSPDSILFGAGSPRSLAASQQPPGLADKVGGTNTADSNPALSASTRFYGAFRSNLNALSGNSPTSEDASSAKTWGGVYHIGPNAGAGYVEAASGTSGSEIQGSPVVAGKITPAIAADDGETTAAKEPFSTFSLNVSNASFLIARAALSKGTLPDASTIRPEEFYNAFDYGDPATADGERVSCRIEQAAHPVLQQRNLVRISMRVPRTGRPDDQSLRLVVLLDTSGSMEREDRAAAVRNAVKLLVAKLHAGDQVTLVGFARTPRLLAERVPGDKADRLLKIIADTPPEGGTNLEEAIRAAGEMARNQFVSGAQNRIILITDGAANLGDANPADLGKLVEGLRQVGVAFDACGVGDGGIEDSVLETLTRKGSGRYLVLDSTRESASAFAGSIAGTLRPAAENVKLQVRFNPARVGHYRLVGFESNRLNKEDFRNDSVAAATLAPGESAIALYEVEALPQGDGDLGQVYVRFRDTSSGAMVERSWEVPYDASARSFDKASPAMKLAGVSALLAEKLRGGPRADVIRLADYEPLVQELRRHYAHEAAVQDLAAMFEDTRRLRRE